MNEERFTEMWPFFSKIAKQVSRLEAGNAKLKQSCSELMQEKEKLTREKSEYFGLYEKEANRHNTTLCELEEAEQLIDKLEAENAKLKAETEKEHEQVCQFIRDMYTGRFEAREEHYWELPQWIRDAIEADPDLQQRRVSDE